MATVYDEVQVCDGCVAVYPLLCEVHWEAMMREPVTKPHKDFVNGWIKRMHVDTMPDFDVADFLRSIGEKR